MTQSANQVSQRWCEVRLWLQLVVIIISIIIVSDLEPPGKTLWPPPPILAVWIRENFKMKTVVAAVIETWNRLEVYLKFIPGAASWFLL